MLSKVNNAGYVTATKTKTFLHMTAQKTMEDHLSPWRLRE